MVWVVFASSFKKRTVIINIHSYQLGGSRICFDLIYNRVISPNTKLSNVPASYLLLKERAWGVDHHKLLFKG